jgi:pimeloyl-ACP methyl ester carboxylesterase
MTAFVLLPGAFRGSWSWEPTASVLRAFGHRVETPDLVLSTDSGRPDLSLDLLVERALSALSAGEAGAEDELVLAGHSFGGLVALVAAATPSVPVDMVIGVDAPVPTAGRRSIDIRPPGVPEPVLDRAAWLDAWPVQAGDGLSEEQADWMNQRLRSEPVGPSLDVVDEVASSVAGLVTGHLFFERTPAGHPVTVTRPSVEQSGVPVQTLDVGHDGIVSHPEAVAESLVALVDAGLGGA